MENINISSPNDGLGDKVRIAFEKVNLNFTELSNSLANKLEKSPDDDSVYGQKNGTPIEISPSDALIIADSVQSASVTGALTLVKEYDLGILGDRCLLTYDFGFTSTISAAEAYTVYMYLFNGTTESVISRYILPTNSNYCGISRTGVFDKEENVFKIYNALGSVASDLVTAPNAITQVPFNIDDNHKLRVYITTNGSLGAVAQFRGLIQLR